MRYILCGFFMMVIGVIVGVVFMIYRCGYILESEKQKANKYFSYFIFLDHWLVCKEQNYNFADYFSKNNVESVAIYGMGKIGKHLKYELENAGIQVVYVIDEGEKIIYGGVNHYNLRDALPFVDLVIVTPIEEFEEIKNKILNNNRMLNVISVNKILAGN